MATRWNVDAIKTERRCAILAGKFEWGFSHLADGTGRKMANPHNRIADKCQPRATLGDILTRYISR